MSESVQRTGGTWWKTPLLHRVGRLEQREDQIFLVLALVIGALTGLAVVAFILLTERMGMRLYPVGGAPWRRLLFPVVGSLGIGTYCIGIFLMREAAACRRRRLRCMRVKGASCYAPCWASFSARRQRLPAG